MKDQTNQSERDLSSQEKKSREEKITQTPSPSGVGLLARVSTLAWNLVIPIVGGVLLGYYLDQRSGNSLTWTLSLLVLGVLIAFSNLYNLYIEHGREQITDENGKNRKGVNDEAK
jgi:predicted F0F1-ATPase subunit